MDTTRVTPFRICVYGVLVVETSVEERLVPNLVVVYFFHRDGGIVEGGVVALLLGCNGARALIPSLVLGRGKPGRPRVNQVQVMLLSFDVAGVPVRRGGVPARLRRGGRLGLAELGQQPPNTIVDRGGPGLTHEGVRAAVV